MDQIAHYQQKIEQLRETISWRIRTSTLITTARGLSFLLTFLAVVGSLTSIFVGVWAYIVPAIPFLMLIGLAAFQETIQSRQTTDENRLNINVRQLRRIKRDWPNLSEADVDVPDEHFHLVKDLDLFGKASLFKILNITNTPLGVRTLANWVLNPASPKEILLRQATSMELKEDAELREELQLLSQAVADARTDPDDLLEWANGELWLEQRSWLKWWSRVSAGLMFFCLFFFFFPFAPKMILGVAGLGLLLIHFGLTICLCGAIHKIFNSVGYRQRDISAYADLFHLSKSIPGESELAKEIRETLSLGRSNAVQSVGQLQTIIGIAQMRRAGLLFLPYIFFQFLFLIDFYTLSWLEKWHKRHAHEIEKWLGSLAQWEALSSLSNLAFHQPDWKLPSVSKEHLAIKAVQLGHPLIPDEERVCNDVEVGPAGSILLVTGSNMSGKSTLLRSIGLNAVLAQAGAVVSAEEFEMPPAQIESSMRIGDSVSKGVSFFMAELRRLKQITIEARKTENDPDRVLLYLLDEILQGTNSKERQIAVIRVCEHLLEAGAIGAISTHDLELADADGISSRCKTIHFREFFDENEEGQKQMSFDYILRDGISPTTNALKLLELVGLGIPSKESNSRSS